MKPVVLNAAAEQELEQALEWYAQQGTTLPASLLAEIRHALDYIAFWPGACPSCELPGSNIEIRRKTLKRFPYCLVFVEAADTIEVIALSHLRRRPHYWVSRIG